MYGFRRMTADDLPMIRAWLAEPEVAAWWGDPDEQYELVRGDMTEPAMRQWIVEHEGRPFAYAQEYEPGAWPDPLFPDLRRGERGIDPFIGVPEMLNQGHGSAFLRALIARLFAEGAPGVVIDPDPANARAIRAYEKAGFRAYLQVDDETWGPALLMRCTPQTFPGP